MSQTNGAIRISTNGAPTTAAPNASTRVSSMAVVTRSTGVVVCSANRTLSDFGFLVIRVGQMLTLGCRDASDAGH